MPRVRPIRTQEEVEKIPPDQPVDIELAEAEPKEVEVAEPEKPEQIRPEVVEQRVYDKADLEPEEPDLRKRLAELERAEVENRRLQQENLEFQQRLQEAQAAQSRSLAERNDAYYAGILNAIDAAEAQADIANRQIDAAVEAGDRETAATARRNLAKAEVALSRYEEQKAQYEEMRKAPPEPRAEVRQQNGLEAAIAQYPEAAKERFRKHPEYVTNPRMTAKLVAAHWDALDQGHTQYSPGYFKYLDDKVFEPLVDEAGEQRPRLAGSGEDRRAVVAAAPPSRDVPLASTGKPQSTRITLTAEERETARMSKSKYQTNAEAELEYARQKLKYQELKKAGAYQERG